LEIFGGGEFDGSG